jgi:hypothetical protein
MHRYIIYMHTLYRQWSSLLLTEIATIWIRPEASRVMRFDALFGHLEESTTIGLRVLM